MLLVRKVSEEVQKYVKDGYARGTDDCARENYFAGQLVFYLLDNKLKVGNKLNSKKKGPYEVVRHLINSKGFSNRQGTEVQSERFTVV